MGRKKRNGDPQKAVGYIRASKEEQKLTPDVQKKMIAEWCDREGVKLIATCEDFGISGATPVDRRPGLLDAVDYLTQHDTGLLIVAKRDRVGRDVFVSAMVERLAAKSGARVVSADGVGNGDTPEAAMMRGIVSVFAAYERALIQTRTRAALALKKARRERTGQIQYGWKLGEDGQHLEPETNEQAIIRTAATLRSKGLSLRAVGESLQMQGMLPRCGRKWHAETVKGILRAEAA